MKRNAPVVLLDVREPEEYEQGAIDGSILVPLDSLTDALPTLGFSKEKQIICICRSGRRSSMAAEFLREQGYTAVNMEGGMRDWIKHRHNEGLLSKEEFDRMSKYLGAH